MNHVIRSICIIPDFIHKIVQISFPAICVQSSGCYIGYIQLLSATQRKFAEKTELV